MGFRLLEPRAFIGFTDSPKPLIALNYCMEPFSQLSFGRLSTKALGAPS